MMPTEPGQCPPAAQAPGTTASSDIALVYISTVTPDEPCFHNPAFSRATQMFQQNLLLGMKHAGLQPSLLLSAPPMPSFPRFKRLFVRASRTYLPERLAIELVPFINCTPVKQITIGLAVLVRLLQWGWRTRRTPHRVVFTHNLSVPPGLFTYLGVRWIGAKLMVSINDVNVPGQTVPDTLLTRADFKVTRWLLPRSDGYVPVADALMEDFAPGRPYVRVEGGITDDLIERTGERHRVKRDENAPFTVVATGNLDETNGIPIILKAFQMLVGDQYRLIIAGRGALAGDVQAAAAQDPRIEYRGFLSFSEVVSLYNTTDVLISMRVTRALNTRYFYPSKMMEYLASGTPVMATCTGHTAEEFGDFCFLIKDETSEGLAEMIRYVASLAPEQRDAMGRKAREYMMTNKTWDAQARRIVHYIRETLCGLGEPLRG